MTINGGKNVSSEDDDYITHPIHVAKLGTARMVALPGTEGSALVYGEPTDGAIVRLQSACQYGEIYGSLECDCRAQLDESLARIKRAGSGILVHLLTHEGRGSGLRAKATAYRHRHTDGLNTFESYARQNIPEDERNYDIATEFLKKYADLHRVRLLTNNPLKVAAVESAGIDVDRVELLPVRPGLSITSRIAERRDYLLVKAQAGHHIPWPRLSRSAGRLRRHSHH